MSEELIQSVERKAAEIALGGAVSKSTSVDGVQVSQTLQDPSKLVEVANALDRRAAARKGILSQLHFVKIKDQP